MGIITQLNNAALGRYIVEERIGSGGMATVFKAHQPQLNRSVAIKVLHEHLVHEATFKDRFEQEARFVARMNHPNIVSIYDFDVAEVQGQTVYYMVMPFISGPTLADMLDMYRKQQLTLPVNRVLQIASDLCAALSYAHKLGMIHRDIKPGNILFDADDRAILTDFGIARLAASSGLTQEGLIVGTPAYMSPEQASADQMDHRSDLYALGCVLFEMISGHIPYPDTGNISVLVKHLQSPVPTISDYLPDLHSELNQFFYRLLAKDPEQRFASAEAILEALAPILSQSKLEQTRIISPITPQTQAVSRSTNYLQTVTLRVIQPIRQNPLGLIAIGLALVALLLVARISQEALNAPAFIPDDIADSMTGDFFFESDFAADSELNNYWQQVDMPDLQAQIAEDLFQISNLRTSAARVILFEPQYMYKNTIISMDARLLPESANTSGYGIVFAHVDNENYHVFAIDGRGRYSIWIRNEGNWQELRQAAMNWTEDAAIQPIGNRNQLILHIYENEVVGYVNEMAVLRLDANSIPSGAIGIYLATPSQGEAYLHVDSYAVNPANPISDSMTDES